MGTIVVKRTRLLVAAAAVVTVMLFLFLDRSNSQMTSDFLSNVKAYTENVPGFSNPRPDEIDQADAADYLGDQLEYDPIESRPQSQYSDKEKGAETTSKEDLERLELSEFFSHLAEVPAKEYPTVVPISEVEHTDKVPIRFYSHNVKNGGDHKLTVGEPVWFIRKNMVVSSIRAHLAPNMVVALQEAQEFQIQDILKGLNALEEPETQWRAYGGGRIDGKEQGEHVPFLVREHEFEVIYDDTFWLNEINTRRPLVGWDAKYPRIATYVTLKHKPSGYHFNFFNTHFDHKGSKARAESTQLLMDKMSSINDWPSFLCGDFNAKPKDGCYKKISKSYTDVHKITMTYNWYGHPDYTVTGFSGNYLKDAKRIDYIFSPKDTIPALEELCKESKNGYSLQLKGYGMLHSKFGGVYMSDHRPLMADFVMKKC